MTPRERILAILNGEEADKIPVASYDMLRKGSQGGWIRRLVNRGMGIIKTVSPHTPAFLFPIWVNPYLDDVKYIVNYYTEKGIIKYRHTLETPAGIISGVMRVNPLPVPVNLDAQEEYFVKEPNDWRVVNYIFNGILGKLSPNYEEIERTEDEIGDKGICFAFIDKTAWQRAWVELASPERAAIDFYERRDEVQEYIEIQKQLHMRIAEITAYSPAKFIDIAENITDMTSPKYYREFCMPIYDYYKKTLDGTDKIIGTHMDGRLKHLENEVAEAAFKVVESFTLPPAGNISLTEAKSAWPDKIFFINTPPHLAWADDKKVKKSYETIAEEWGNKKGLLLEHSEDLPLEKVESHMSAALDAFGY